MHTKGYSETKSKERSSKRHKPLLPFKPKAMRTIPTISTGSSEASTQRFDALSLEPRPQRPRRTAHSLEPAATAESGLNRRTRRHTRASRAERQPSTPNNVAPVIPEVYDHPEPEEFRSPSSCSQSSTFSTQSQSSISHFTQGQVEYNTFTSSGYNVPNTPSALPYTAPDLDLSFEEMSNAHFHEFTYQGHPPLSAFQEPFHVPPTPGMPQNLSFLTDHSAYSTAGQNLTGTDSSYFFPNAEEYPSYPQLYPLTLTSPPTLGVNPTLYLSPPNTISYNVDDRFIFSHEDDEFLRRPLNL
ncbi:hypothetical protein D9756_000330 [Leucocoprinus leucothites]|uniref:Uncharacterized protein n=1 Tax=Leucocoprinus leucothites TaxID=201217 RepID=A0A8H5GG58_9AGAR|nr:hypothetical protein D9756_000330 [Leucoagaricus leucothites]